MHGGGIHRRDVAVANDRIALVGDIAAAVGPSTRVVDVSGLVLTPGLVTPHFHQWHSNHNPTTVAQCLLQQGTTAFADGFYGPAIVAGPAAVRLLAEEFLATPLKLILLAPTHAYVQNRAAGFPPAPESPDIDDLQAMLDWPICRGLEETFYDVLCDPQSRDPQLLELVSRALARGKVATGHGVEPESPAQLAAWAAAGITNDHEGIDATAVERRLEAGLHVLLRHGPGFANLPETAGGVVSGAHPLDAFALCNDIAWADTIFDHGFDETLRQAIAAGIDPVDAVRLATILPARYYRVDHDIGALLPGRLADIVAVSDLASFEIHSVYADGLAVVEDGQPVLQLEPPDRPAWALRTMRVPSVPTASQLALAAPVQDGEVTVRVIEITDGAYLSGEEHEQVQVRDGIVCPSAGDGINHVAVLERLDGSGAFGVGLVRGFGLERGAIASASNPLTQAVVAVGADLDSLALAIAAVVEGEGAFVAVDRGSVVADFPTPLFGQTGSLGWAQSRERITALVGAWRDLGCRLEYPFAYLEFVAATSEPYLRVSTHGVVRAEPSGSPRVRVVPVIVGEQS